MHDECSLLTFYSVTDKCLNSYPILLLFSGNFRNNTNLLDIHIKSLYIIDTTVSWI